MRVEVKRREVCLVQGIAMEIKRNIICSICVLIIISVSWYVGDKLAKHSYGQLSVSITDINCTSDGPYELHIETNHDNRKFWINRNYEVSAHYDNVKKDQEIRVGIENRIGVLGSMIFTVEEIKNQKSIGQYIEYTLSSKCNVLMMVDWTYYPFYYPRMYNISFHV